MIYLDFEGYMNEKPSFVGYKIGSQFKQIILDKNFLQLTKETDIEFQEYEKLCEEIILVSNRTNQPIVAWSEYELTILKKFQDDINYCNLKKIVESKIKKDRNLTEIHKGMSQYWIGQRRTRIGKINLNNNPFLRKRWDLQTVLKLLDYPHLNSTYGKGKVTARLTAIKKGLIRGGSYKKLTPIQKRKWTNLKQHNFIDVDGLEYIVKKLKISY